MGSTLLECTVDCLTRFGQGGTICPRLLAPKHRGVEQWQLVGLITRRSLVRIQPPQLFDTADQNLRCFCYATRLEPATCWSQTQLFNSNPDLRLHCYFIWCVGSGKTIVFCCVNSTALFYFRVKGQFQNLGLIHMRSRNVTATLRCSRRSLV